MNSDIGRLVDWILIDPTLGRSVLGFKRWNCDIHESYKPLRLFFRPIQVIDDHGIETAEKLSVSEKSIAANRQYVGGEVTSFVELRNQFNVVFAGQAVKLQLDVGSSGD